METRSTTIIGKNRNSPFKMEYCLHDNGEEKVVFIMGLLLGGKYWSSVIDYLIKSSPNKYQCLTFDHVGVGNSEFSRFSSVKDLASDVNELIQHLKWDKVHVVGVSLGAFIGYELSLLVPNKIKTLNLMSFPPSVNGGMYFDRDFRQLYLSDFKAKKLNIDPAIILTDLMYSKSFLDSPSIIKEGPNKKYIIPLVSKMYTERMKIKPMIILSHMFCMIKYKFKPIKSKELLLKRQFPIVMFFGTDDKLMNWKKVIQTYEAIQPNLIYFCQDFGHCLQFEDIFSINKKTEHFLNYPITNPNKEFLKQQTILKNNLTNSDEYSKSVFKKDYEEIESLTNNQYYLPIIQPQPQRPNFTINNGFNLLFNRLSSCILSNLKKIKL